MSVAKLDHYGLLHAAGADARAFLHAQLTNDLENLAPGRARYAGWCSAKGRLLATFLVVPHADGYLLQLARDLVPVGAQAPVDVHPPLQGQALRRERTMDAIRRLGPDAGEPLP
jgi:glycine cleavage system aminomethyltransferase T